MISLRYVLENGSSSKIARVGNESIVAVYLFMGGETTPSRAVAQTGGHGHRLKKHILMEEFNCVGPVLRPLLHHTGTPDDPVQPASFGGTAIVPLAVADRRSLVIERANDDVGTFATMLGCDPKA